MTSSGPVSARIPWLERLAYSLGNVCETIVTRAFELFALFFYTQVRGLSGTLAGAAILVAMVVDAVSDPLVGSYSDSLQSRFGRRHTLMFLSAVPTGLCFVILFAPPAALTGPALALWLTAAAIGLRVSLTFFHIPWSTQIAELTTDMKERVTLAVMRNIFASGAGFAVLAVAFDVFFVPSVAFPRGQENPHAYLPFAVTIGAALVVTILLSATGTCRRMLRIERAQSTRPVRFTPRSLWPAWRDMVFRFRSFRALLLGSLFLLTAFSMFNALALYLGSYFWALSGAAIKSWQFATLIGVVVTLVVGKPIVDRFSLRGLFGGGIAACVLLFSLPILLRVGGMLAVAPASVLRLLVATNALAGFALGIVMIVSAVIASETAADYERRTGVKSTAMLFGFVFLAMKTASGLGKLLAGVIVDVAHVPVARDAQLMTHAQLDALGGWCCVTLLLLGALGCLAFSGYRSPARPESEPESEPKPKPDTESVAGAGYLRPDPT